MPKCNFMECGLFINLQKFWTQIPLVKKVLPPLDLDSFILVLILISLNVVERSLLL